MLVILVLAVFLFLLFYLKSLEVVCSKKAVSVYMQNTPDPAQSTQTKPESELPESENIVRFRSEPFRMAADTGYTLHKDVYKRQALNRLSGKNSRRPMVKPSGAQILILSRTLFLKKCAQSMGAQPLFI